MAAERVGTLVAALERTRATETARLHFQSMGIGLGEFLEMGGHERTAGLARSAKRAADRFIPGHPGGPAGVIDFVQQRSLVPIGESNWTLVTPDREYSGEPGEWELIIEVEQQLGCDQPLWLLALVAGLADAQEPEDTHLHGERCRLFQATASYSCAANASITKLGPVTGVLLIPNAPALKGTGDASDFDTERMPLGIWVDDQNHIRRVLLAMPGGWSQNLELWDFGVPEPIKLPPDSDVVYTSDNRKFGSDA